MTNETPITVIGNLTADPELRYTPKGIAVANFTVASTPQKFDRKTNEWVDEEALFLRGTVWREYAEHIAASLHKGSRVIVHGNLRQRQYETKEGEKRSSYELDVIEMGPALRYATASITQAGSRTQAQNRQTVRQDDEPWTTPSGDDSWDTTSIPAGNYDDETPF